MAVAEPSSETHSSPKSHGSPQLQRVAHAPTSPGPDPGALSSVNTQSASTPQASLTPSVQNSWQRPTVAGASARQTPRHSFPVPEGSQLAPMGLPLGASSTHSPLTGSHTAGAAQSPEPLQRGRH